MVEKKDLEHSSLVLLRVLYTFTRILSGEPIRIKDGKDKHYRVLNLPHDRFNGVKVDTSMASAVLGLAFPPKLFVFSKEELSCLGGDQSVEGWFKKDLSFLDFIQLAESVNMEDDSFKEFYKLWEADVETAFRKKLELSGEIKVQEAAKLDDDGRVM